MFVTFFAGFILVVTVLVVLDLFVLNRKEHVIKVREALGWSAMWITFALIFNVMVYFFYGHNWLGFNDAIKTDLAGHGREAAISFLNCYLLELSLSMDNLFVFATILTYFRVPLEKQHRVLVWGILGAIILRGVMIAAGAALVSRFEWIIFVFGVILIITAIRMLMPGSDELQPERNIFIRFARKVYPTTDNLHGSRFFVRIENVLHMTPMFLALLLVDVADVMFAIDSIPAAFGVTTDTFIVFTSNICAIMGLRSMYFALVGMMHKFRYLKPSIVLLLAYIGVKMLLPLLGHIDGDAKIDWHIPNTVSLAVIFGVLTLGIVASLLSPHKGGPSEGEALAVDDDRREVERNDDLDDELSRDETGERAARIRSPLDSSSSVRTPSS